MSLTYRAGGGLWPVAVLAVGVSAGAHVMLPVTLLQRAAAPEPEVTRKDTGIEGAIMFDLSDIIAAPSQAGEDSQEVAEAEEAPTVTESPEVVDPSKAAEEPILNQTPYDVQDDELKFGIASPEPAEEVDDKAHETAAEYQEEQVNEASSLGAVAADASQASVSGVDSEDEAEKAQASSEGLTADQLEEITEWQKSVVLRIAKAKTYPKSARKKGVQGEVRVKFTIDRYGNVIAREVETSSGSSVLDQAALDVFDALEKLPTPPNHLSGESFTLMIPLNYSIRKKG
ncbi:energy transducer TonB [Actibacterium lipolyticum]|uniref:Gram-negative bacterial tonB protein n=1 Tax=Actibacterium lipolyticum TaxID=1524263 RepID=A0A238KLQ7_9RHOB|nr:TonB family protein [Actibacterium lipolyticum]SMX43698.1 Gram-negative bacterial tonB protein [Actibacterium lipolyticum]